MVVDLEILVALAIMVVSVIHRMDTDTQVMDTVATAITTIIVVITISSKDSKLANNYTKFKN